MIINPTENELENLTMIIYMITNKINNKKYIGKSKYTFNRRYEGKKWWMHTDNILLKRAVEKYGLENFYITILDYEVSSNQELKKKETDYIIDFNTLRPNGYNFILSQDQKFNHTPKRICEYYETGNYRLKSPTGEIIEFYNIADFCNKNNLDRMSIGAVLNGKYKQCNYWTLPDVSIKERKIKSSTGEIFTIKQGELRRFCREQGFSGHCGLNLVLLGKEKEYKGWTLP